MFDEKTLGVIQAPSVNYKTVLQGPTGCGKTTVLIERYRHMVEKMGIPSDSILVLVLNRAQAELWTEKASFKASGRIWISTYYSFIQEQINTYYPLVLKNCTDIRNKDLRPVFLPFEASRYLVSKVVDWHRENKGIFPSITAESDRIAGDLVNNLFKAAASCFPFDEISRRLFNSLPVKEDDKRESYRESEEVLSAYKKKCMSLGVFDYGMAVEIYSTCLLQDEEYKRHFTQRVRHLMVDNIEEKFPAEIDFIGMMQHYLDTCILSYNYEKGSENGWEGVHRYLKEKITGGYEVIGLGKSHTCNTFMYEFSEMLFENIRSSSVKKHKSPVIERIPPVELRSEMLENIGDKICRLINEDGYQAADIAVLSTYADPVTELVISKVANERGVQVNNIARKERIVDNEVNFSLIVLAQLCFPSYGFYPNTDYLRVLAGRLFGVDPVRAWLLAEEIHAEGAFPHPELLKTSKNWDRLKSRVNVDRYSFIHEWVEAHKKISKTLSIDRFFYKAFLEILLTEQMSLADIRQVAMLIQRAEKFVDALNRFTNMNSGKGFLEVLLAGMKKSDSGSAEAEGENEKGAVLLATPQTYLAGPFHHKVILLAGISSRNWIPRNVKELTNPIVLHRAWDPAQVYTEELEEENQKAGVASILRAVTKRCGEKLVVFESALSANGYENDGLLGEYL